MPSIAARMPRKRRVTTSEERELLDLKRKLDDAEEHAKRIRARRNCLISELLDSGARQVDIAEILGITERAVSDARRRAGQDA